jgi:hypothetical protein
MQSGEHLNLEVNPSTRPVYRGEGLPDRIAHEIVSAPTISSEHDGRQCTRRRPIALGRPDHELPSSSSLSPSAVGETVIPRFDRTTEV